MYRGYGVILPSSFTRVLPNAFGCSPSTPVSDCGTGRRVVPRGLFAAGTSRGFQIELSALRHGGVYRPDPCVPGVPPAFNLPARAAEY